MSGARTAALSDVSRLASAATLGASGTALLYVLIFKAQALAAPASVFTLAMATLVLFKHRDNVRRLLTGTEHRFEKARVLGRLWAPRR